MGERGSFENRAKSKFRDEVVLVPSEPSWGTEGTRASFQNRARGLFEVLGKAKEDKKETAVAEKGAETWVVSVDAEAKAAEEPQGSLFHPEFSV